jgi:cysteine synthase A
MSTWAAEAIRRVRSTHTPTPLRTLRVGRTEIALKDETALPTGSTKHRTVAAMFCHAITNGEITETTQVITATAGPVAIAAAHFATLLNLRSTALVPAKTAEEVLARIEKEGGRWQRAEQPPAALQQEAQALADRWGAHFLDHFAAAEPAVTAWPPTIADELFTQLPEPPQWIVVGAGTGATATAVGRHIHKEGLPTKLAVVDPENSAYFPAWATGARDYGTGMPSRIPGIGRPRVEPGFHPGVVDLVIPVPDAATAAALLWLHERGINAGPATGTSVWGIHHLTTTMNERGPLATIITDSGDPYRTTHLNREWLNANGLDPAPYEPELDQAGGAQTWFSSP